MSHTVRVVEFGDARVAKEPEPELVVCGIGIFQRCGRVHVEGDLRHEGDGGAARVLGQRR